MRPIFATLLTGLSIALLSCGRPSSSRAISSRILNYNVNLLTALFPGVPPHTLDPAASPKEQLELLDTNLPSAWSLVYEAKKDFATVSQYMEDGWVVLALLDTGDIAWVGDSAKLGEKSFLQVFYRSDKQAQVWPADSFRV